MTRIEISLDRQELDLFRGDELVRTYRISSGEKGMGFEEGSFRTPTGRFAIAGKIGEGEPIHTRFHARVPVGIWNPEDGGDGDLILSRILRLDGLDEENANTLERHIYIHGTNREDQIGRPSSHGCIRLANRDMIELFDQVADGTEVTIHPHTVPKAKLLFVDCDSTLSAIEGIDELARLSDPAIFAKVVALTHAAMNGDVPLHEVFAKRMEIIRPDKSMADEVARLYIEHIVPGAREFIEMARSRGWIPVILSGGFEPLIRPLADLLGINHVEAVPFFLNESGGYAGYGTNYPTTRNLGKNEIINEWKRATLPARVVMLGDGVSDLETQPEVDVMVGFGGIVIREKVKIGADVWLESFSETSQLEVLLE
jgi:HAD superfamily phosphoserine phosphatase-like hydrolase